jgi:hypothetical protein
MAKNPYSMRSLARSLGLSYSLLMRGLREERDAERTKGLPVGYRGITARSWMSRGNPAAGRVAGTATHARLKA